MLRTRSDQSVSVVQEPRGSFVLPKRAIAWLELVGSGPATTMATKGPVTESAVRGATM